MVHIEGIGLINFEFTGCRFLGRIQTTSYRAALLDPMVCTRELRTHCAYEPLARVRFGVNVGEVLARIIHECRREAFETEARRGFLHVRLTQAYLQSVEEAEREKSRRSIGSDAGAGIHK